MTSRIWIFSEGTREGHHREANWGWVMKALMLTEDNKKLLKGNDKPRIMHMNQCVCVHVCLCICMH